MAQIAKLVGGAGTGKTTELLSLMEKVASTGIDPTEIGFVSFTRAARAEAAERAADLFGIPIHMLERDGWFRTLHSICYRALGVNKNQLIAGDKKSRDWLEEALQQSVKMANSIDEVTEQPFAGNSEAANVLNLWSAARSKLQGFEPTWKEARRCDERTPGLDRCSYIIEQYEHHKRLDHRLDFTDLALKFAGYRVTTNGVEEVEQEGETPNVPCWFFDEQQDASPLLHEVCERLIENARLAYLVGDPFQSIYGWAGADHSCFLNLKADKEKTMPRSYRCPPIIANLGERILRRCSDYYDRKIAPAEHHGRIDRSYHIGAIEQNVSPSQSWLLLARTNQQATRLAAACEDASIPWRPTKGAGGFAAPAKQELLAALAAIQNGRSLTETQIRRLFMLTPTSFGDVKLMTHGSKAKFNERGIPEDQRWRLSEPLECEQLLYDLGFTEGFFKLIWDGDVSFYKDFGKFWRAAKTHGIEAVQNPSVRVGTVHSVKGSEADNVILLTTVSRPIVRSQSHRSGFDEERRVEYVAVTRARERLLLIDEPKRKHKMHIPA